MQKIALHMQVKPIESTLKAFAYLNKPPRICTALELKVKKYQKILFSKGQQNCL